MRYLLVPLVILATTDSLLSQVYEVIPRDFGAGYAIAEGGTLKVVDGEIAEWNVRVDGPTPFTFTNETASISTRGVTITPTQIGIDGTGAASVDVAFLALGSPAECVFEQQSCATTLDWNFTKIPERGPRA